jgi:hypothetical protein
LTNPSKICTQIAFVKNRSLKERLSEPFHMKRNLHTQSRNNIPIIKFESDVFWILPDSTAFGRAGLAAFRPGQTLASAGGEPRGSPAADISLRCRIYPRNGLCYGRTTMARALVCGGL